MEVLAESTAVAVINTGIENIDLTDWMFTLKEEEYQACSTAHITCGTSLRKDGRRLSVNVEQVGDSLLVQHYVEDISKKDHCRVTSYSDSFSATGRTKLGIAWELQLKQLSPDSCELSNHVTVSLTNEFASLLNQNNVHDLSTIKIRMEENLVSHNQEETPLFAKDIETKALAGTWKITTT